MQRKTKKPRGIGFMVSCQHGLRCVARLVLIMILLAGCTATRFLKEGETFYAGAEIDVVSEKVQGQNEIKKKLQEYIKPKPNSKFLGSRPGPWFYFIAGTPKKQKGFRYFLKNRLGKKPVLLSDVDPERIASTLENEFNNEGYFRSKVTREIVSNRKTSRIIYSTYLNPPFHLNNINYLLFDTLTSDATNRLKKESLLKTDQRYSLDRLQAEQNRIEVAAQNMGYFYFDDRYLLFEADSTVGQRGVDLDLIFESDSPAKAKRIYTIRSVNVFPSYSLGNDSLSTTGDTIKIKGYNYIDNLHAFHPEIITEVINIRKDSIYRKIDHEYTLSRLMSLNTFKFVNVKFTDDPLDSSSLHANVYMTPLTKKSLRLQLQVVSKSNNFVGPGMEVTFTNRNFLRGAELFQLRLSGAYESQISRQQSGALNAVEIGVEASLTVPRFITPFNIPYRSAKYLPQTQFRVGYNLQQRLQFFKLTSFNVGYGYTWRETTLKTHSFFPIDLSYVRSSNTSAEFDQRLAENPTLANSFQDQFIPGLTYSFTLNTQLREDIDLKYIQQNQNKSNFYFHSTIGLAGNLLNLIQSAGNPGGQPYEVFGFPYSQFIRGEIDFRYYLQFDRHQKLATRLAMGIGYAFGNSSHLPYIKQFAVGGSNSIRAFPARSVGPGTFNIRDNAAGAPLFIDQRSDMKLEANAEYRFDIVKSLKGAVFVDAGNIWSLGEDDREGAAFNKNTFLNELAAGTGVGLRYDFSFFILRLDAAFPIRKPYLPINDRWVLDKIDFNSSDWRRENLILNIAIGYPF